MKTQVKNSNCKSNATVKYALIIGIFFGIVATSCCEKVCHTYDGAQRAEIRRSLTSTTKHAIKCGYSTYRKRRN